VSYRTLSVGTRIAIVFGVAVTLGFSFSYLADRLEKRSATKSISQLRKKVRKVDETRRVQMQALSQDKIAQLSRELELARRDRQNALEETRLERERVILLERTHIPSLQARIDEQEAVLRQKDKTILQSQDEAVKAKADVVVQKNAVRMLEARARDFESEKTSLIATINSLRTNISQQDTIIKTLQDNLSRQQSISNGYEAQLKSLQAELIKARAETQTQSECVIRNESRIQDLSSTIDSLNRQITQASDELRMKKAEIEETRQQVVKAQQDNQQLQNDYDLLLQQVAQRDQERKLLESKIARMESVKTSAQALSDAQRLEMAAQQQKVLQLESEVGVYKQKLMQQDSELDARRKGIESLRQENGSLCIRLEAAQKELGLSPAAVKESAGQMKQKEESVPGQGKQ